MRRRMTIEWKIAGQPRPYADSVQIAVITFEMALSANAPWRPSDLATAESHIKEYFNVKENGEWYQERMDYLKKVSPGVWEIKLTQPYLD